MMKWPVFSKVSNFRQADLFFGRIHFTSFILENFRRVIQSCSRYQLRMSTPFVQQLSGLIHEFFLSYKAPSWFYVGPALKLFKIQHFHGLSNLDEDFLRFFFKDDVNLLKLIPEMRYCHHQLIILLLKEEYNLASCSACGAISKMHRYNFRRRIDSYSNLSQPELNGIYKRLKNFS